MFGSRLYGPCVLGVALLGACQSPEEAVDIAGPATFEEFVASLPVASDGAWIVEGHVPVFDREELYDYYALTRYPDALILDQNDSGVDNKYSVSGATQLTYCVSDAFGANKALVRDTLAAATKEWMDATKIASGDAASVRFSYVAAEDAACTASNARVFFNVAPAPASAAYDARSFRPSFARSQRQLLIHQNAFPTWRSQTFQGVLRHELGHVLGFRHEHIRSAANNCESDDLTYREITPYDTPSVMHYRQAAEADCGTNGASDYTLTAFDQAGVRCVYTTQARSAGVTDTAADACLVTKALGATSGVQFTADESGAVFKLERVTAANGVATTRVWKFSTADERVAPTWTKLWEQAGDDTSTELKAGFNQLYRVQKADTSPVAPAKLWRWTGAAWQAMTGLPGTSVVAGQGDLFRLNANGSIDRFPAGSASATSILSTAASGRSIFAGRDRVYRVDADAKAYMWNPAAGAGTWTLIGSGLKSLAADRFGTVYGLLNDAAGTIMQRNAATGAWATIGAGSAKLYGGLDTLYDSPLGAPSTVRRRVGTSSTWKKFALGAKAFFRGGDFKYKVGSDDKVYLYLNP